MSPQIYEINIEITITIIYIGVEVNYLLQDHQISFFPQKLDNIVSNEVDNIGLIR